MDFLIVMLGIIAPISVVGDFIGYLRTGRRFISDKWYRSFEWLFILIPFLLMAAFDGWNVNSCCGSTAFFSPSHRLSIYTLMVLCLGAYFYSSFREKIAPPVAEVLVNCLLLIGFVGNIFIFFQIPETLLGLMINLPVGILIIYVTIKNHRLLTSTISGRDTVVVDSIEQGRLKRLCRQLLQLRPYVRLPLLIVLCLPLLALFVAILCLFGQQPDALVRAFTDTYKNGLSQINDQCKGVTCGGHYLCTIAAKGHPSLVKPTRSGIRGGREIICNRQLLVSNAFEEWLEQRLPAIHRPVRIFYNIIGSFIHRYYRAFDQKWVSGLIYLLMKPLEWVFILVLYTVDRNPETRIAQQYMSRADREKIGRRESRAPGSSGSSSG